MQILNLEPFKQNPLTTEPFPFMVVKGIFQEQAIPELTKDFPDITNAGLYPAEVLEMGPAMHKLLEELCSDEFRQAVEEKFGMDLKDRPPMITLRKYARSKDGRIHADTDSKVITILLYLNEDWPYEGGQLRFLRSPDDLNSTIEEITPLAGTMAIFKVTPNGWHGHVKHEGERRVLMLNYMVSEELRNRETNRHKFSAKVKNFKHKVGIG